jgi:hypothetical protein
MLPSSVAECTHELVCLTKVSNQINMTQRGHTLTYDVHTAAAAVPSIPAPVSLSQWTPVWLRYFSIA